jgi:beta-fructofuranosidase
MDYDPQLLTRVRRDPHRPTYHFVPPANWMNDPNGLIQWKGTYHLFYQHNPYAADWGPMHWGHATSQDLLHWAHQPLALSPSASGPDQDGVWSGVAVDSGDGPVIVYSGNRDGQQRCCLAFGHDDLKTLQKYPGNPVIPEIPADFPIYQYRDHTVWRSDGTWYQGIGSGIRGVGPAVLLYRSTDLIHWDFLGPLLVGSAELSQPLPAGMMWECPDVFRLNGRDVLVVSAFSEGQPMYTAYCVGMIEEHRFQPRLFRRLDHGNVDFYAPQSFSNAQGERIQFGWLREARQRQACLEAGWAGVQSLPRLLGLTHAGELSVRPHPQVDSLRGAGVSYGAIELAPGFTPLQALPGRALELRARFAPAASQGASQYGLRFFCSSDGQEETRLIYESAGGLLRLERDHSSLDPAPDRSPLMARPRLSAQEPLDLHVYLDGSVVEVFINERETLSGRVYPARPDSTGAGLFASGGRARLLSLEAWQMLATNE